MFAYLKINTALIICVAFVFRLLFVNIGLLSSSNSSQTQDVLIKYFSETQKRRRNAEVAVKPATIDYSVAELCEEGSDDDKDLVKANSPAVLSILYSFLKNIIFIPKSNTLFDFLRCNLSSKKYLAISVLRI